MSSRRANNAKETRRYLDARINLLLSRASSIDDAITADSHAAFVSCPIFLSFFFFLIRIALNRATLYFLFLLYFFPCFSIEIVITQLTDIQISDIKHRIARICTSILALRTDMSNVSSHFCNRSVIYVKTLCVPIYWRIIIFYEYPTFELASTSTKSFLYKPLETFISLQFMSICL